MRSNRNSSVPCESGFSKHWTVARPIRPRQHVTFNYNQLAGRGTWARKTKRQPPAQETGAFCFLPNAAFSHNTAVIMQTPAMRAAEEVARLLRRLGLEQNELDGCLAHLSWTSKDGHRLSAIAHAIQPFNDAFLNDLYRTLMQFDSTAKTLGSPTVFDQIKARQRGYYRRLFEGK